MGSILSPKVAPASQTTPLAIKPKSTVDPNRGEGAARARARAAQAAAAGGKSRFRVDSSPDLQTPGSGGLRIPNSGRR